jgi:hypothetical protein
MEIWFSIARMLVENLHLFEKVKGWDDHERVVIGAIAVLAALLKENEIPSEAVPEIRKLFASLSNMQMNAISDVIEKIS